MATRKVIAYPMHEYEFGRISGRIRPSAQTESYIVGEMDDADIAQMTKDGLVIEVLDDPSPVAVSEPSSTSTPRGELSSTMRATAARTLPGRGRDPVMHASKDNIFVLRIVGPCMLDEWRREVESLGATLMERLPDNGYMVELSLPQEAALQRLPFVRDVRLFSSSDASSAMFSVPIRQTELLTVGSGGDEDPVLRETQSEATAREWEFNTSTDVVEEVYDSDDEGGGGAISVPEPTLVFEALLHRAEDIGDVKTWLSRNNIPVIATGKRKLRVMLPMDSQPLRNLEALPEVKQLVEYVEPRIDNEIARIVIGLEAPAAVGLAVSPWLHEGSGEIIAIADSGLDQQHPDFQGRIEGVVSRGRPGDSSDPHGHGTHVAGSALGDGSASSGHRRGTAPAAKLFFQSIMDTKGGLGGLPIDLADLFDEAYQAGARIHNNSWSANTKSYYTFNALEVDEYVDAHPDFLVVIAAGNEGSAKNPFNTQPGFVDWQSIGSPATAKNALTVGASRNGRSDGGFSQRSYADFDPKRFGLPPIATQTVSGDVESLAAFSARGPCDPRRIKPDLVAPGTDILSARAAGAPDAHYWGFLPGEPHYGFMGGTSMAAPLVAGCAALVREYYRVEHAHLPSAALVKATLINSTRRLTGIDANAEHDKLPNFHQGFGALHMPHAYPNVREPWFKLAFVDTQKDNVPFRGNGERRRFEFKVQGGAFLRLCLVWTDRAAGSALQNNLAIMLEHTALMPPKVSGNVDRPSPLGPIDRDNNVHIIRIDNPPPGNYMVQVFAPNLTTSPQHWALVITGDLDGGLDQLD